MSIFFRLLGVGIDDKAHKLREIVHAHIDNRKVFEVPPATFTEISGSPFAYWLSEKMRSIFSILPRFDSTSGQEVRLGASTKNDARFVRLWYEIQSANRWSTYANGSRFGQFFQDYQAVVLTEGGFRELSAYLVQKFPYLKGNPGWILHLENDYSQAAIGWPLRTHSFSPHALPAGTVFSARTYAAYVPESKRSCIAALLTSRAVDFLLKAMLGRSGHPEFVTGVVRALPFPKELPTDRLSTLFDEACRMAQTESLFDETSLFFVMPRTLAAQHPTFKAEATADVVGSLSQLRAKIDDLAFEAYQMDSEAREEVRRWYGESASSNSDQVPGDEAEDIEALAFDNESALLSWSVGVAFNRFAPRPGTQESHPKLEPFKSIPRVSPGMVTAATATSTNSSRIELLVDDHGHPADLTTQVTRILDQVNIAPTKQSTTLRRWLARDFFSLHIKMYSRNRRTSPIYWQLATPSISYSVWLYIHAFTEDTLYNVQHAYVSPKLIHEERKLESLRAGHGTNPNAAQHKELAAQEAFVEELRALLDEVKRVSPLWNPNLDDGVILSFALLWRLVPHHKPWQKELKAKWDELCDGQYDWAHLAMHLWPERVVPKCATDRSLAIAHGIEEVFWMEGEDGKWRPRPIPARSIEALVNERTSPAVKAALKDLLEAPTALSSGRRGRPRGRRGAAGETA